ncbi:hypothetical protein GW17_00037480 [Ensete ventricosum]|nr:hypothetical protein GW17_00037480 [Ensete ventricosum]
MQSEKGAREAPPDRDLKSPPQATERFELFVSEEGLGRLTAAEVVGATWDRWANEGPTQPRHKGTKQEGVDSNLITGDRWTMMEGL